MLPWSCSAGGLCVATCMLPHADKSACMLGQQTHKAEVSWGKTRSVFALCCTLHVC